MKRLMLGNEAVARGAWEAGVRVIASYPGTPSTEITEYASQYDEIYCEWAPNEKVGAEVAIGASIGGARAMTCMKHVGLNVAADPLFTNAYSGVNAGLVFAVADDPGMHSSQNEQDTRMVGRAAHVPVLVPSDSMECLEFTKKAFEISEQYDTPVILRLVTRIAHAQSAVDTSERSGAPLKDYEKNYMKYTMMPAMARARHIVVEARESKMAEDACAWPINRVEMRGTEIGVICAGAEYQYVREALPDVSVLKLGLVNPLPEKLIRDFAKKVKRLIIVEELESLIEEQVKAWGINCEGKSLFTRQGEYSAALIAQKLAGASASPQPLMPSLPVRPPVLCPGCPHRATYYMFNKLKLTANGDIGCYTLGSLPPLNGSDTCQCMGASIGMSMGMEKGRGKDFARNVIGVIGDSTFLHSGMTGLLDMAYNGSTGTVVIVDNHITGMTGHQQNPATGKTIKGDPARKVDLETLVRSLGAESVVVVDPFDLRALEATLKEETAREALSVVIARRPCALIKKSSEPPVRVDQGKCKKCKMCMRIGCPAIENKNDTIEINPALCVGCGLCQKICAFGAMQKAEV